MTHKTGILDTNAISTLRNQIDNIDEQIQTLINQRAKIAQEVAKKFRTAKWRKNGSLIS